MLCTGTLFGQAGALSFNTPVYNPLTGYTSVAVDWEDNTFATAKGVRIELGLNITSPCIDVAATTVHPDFANDVSFSSSGVIINKTSSQPFAVQSNHTPLLTLYFRAAPGSTATLLSTFAKLRDINNIFHNITFPDPNALNMTMPDPINIKGLVRKAPNAFAQCINGVNGGISDVAMTYSAGTLACFPTYTAYSTFSGFPSNPYAEVLPTGAYSVDVPSHYIYTITPTKTGDCDCGIGAEDFNEGRNIILGIESTPTLAELIALDFNNSGTTYTSDLVGMQNCLLGLFSPPTAWTAWFFVPIVAYNANNPPSGFPILPTLPTAITTPLVISPLFAQDFYGIKRGDLDGSCTDCDDEFFRAPDPTSDRSVTKVIHYHLEKPEMVKGQTADWYLTLNEDVDQLAVLGLDLELDNQAIEVLDVQADDISAEFLQSNISVRTGQTPLRIKWFSGNPNGETFQKGQRLVRLRVLAKKDEAQAELVVRDSKSDKPNGYYQNGAQAAFIELSREHTDAFELRLLGGNPVQGSATFELSSPSATDVRLQLVNAQGHVVQTLTLSGFKGRQITELHEVESLQPGVYLLNAATQSQNTYVRFIKL